MPASRHLLSIGAGRRARGVSTDRRRGGAAARATHDSISPMHSTVRGTSIWAATRAALIGHDPPGAAELDLRPILAAELRTTPALLLVVLLTAFLVADGDPKIWAWAGAMGLSAGLRTGLAATHQAAAEPVRARDRVGRGLLALYAIDLVLWGVLLATLIPAGPLEIVALCAAGSTVLLAAFSLGNWPRAWTAEIGGWTAIAALMFARGGPLASLPTAVFVLWLAAVWWLGRVRARRGPVREPRAESKRGVRTRPGWRAAVLAMPNPVFVARSGRITDLNNAAAQFVGQDERSLLGARVEEVLRADPPDSFDPLRAQSGQTAVEVLPVGQTFNGAGAWSARVRVVEPGQADSPVVIALTRAEDEHSGSAGLMEDARRLVQWCGAGAGEPWYRDEHGRLFLPRQFVAAFGGAGGNVALDFPLAHWVHEAQRPAVNAAYRETLERGETFDRAIELVDLAGRAKPMRVVCLVASAKPPGFAPVIGVLARAPRDAVLPRAGDLMRRMPVLVWLVDRSGCVVAARGSEPWRWGMREGLPPRPIWADAFGFRGDAQRDVQTALRRALAGRASFDLVNSRVTTAGGRIVLRSHFVPFSLSTEGSAAPAVLVLDTVASPQQLSEIDRLRRSKAQYKALVDASISLIWACDSRFQFSYTSRRAVREIYGYGETELLGRSVVELLHPGLDQTAAKRALARLRTGETLRDLDMVHVARDGQRIVVAASAVPLKGSDGAFAGAIGMNIDMTMLKQRERRLTEALRIERTVLDAAGQAIAVVKEDLVVRCNDAVLRLLAALPAQLARTPIAEYFDRVEQWSEVAAAADAACTTDRAVTLELQIRPGTRQSSSVPTWCQLTVRAIAPREYVIVLADIEQIRHREAEALHEAHHDDLTGLPNRRLLAIRAVRALAATGLRDTRCAVIAIDLDGFREVNERLGHAAGDATLREVAARLLRVMRPQDTVARRGGAEFAVLVPDAGSRADVERIAARVLAAIEAPLAAGPQGRAQLTAHLGIACAPEHGRELERLLELADRAVLEARQTDGARFVVAGAAADNVTPSAPRAALAS